MVGAWARSQEGPDEASEVGGKKFGSGFKLKTLIGHLRKVRTLL